MLLHLEEQVICNRELEFVPLRSDTDSADQREMFSFFTRNRNFIDPDRDSIFFTLKLFSLHES